MNYYQLSYDVQGSEKDSSRNEAALTTLLMALQQELSAACIYRPVRTTLLFLTEKNLSEVNVVASKWASAEKAYYVLCKVQAGTKTKEGTDTYYYAEQPSADLQKTIREKLASLATK